MFCRRKFMQNWKNYNLIVFESFRQAGRLKLRNAKFLDFEFQPISFKLQII